DGRLSRAQAPGPLGGGGGHEGTGGPRHRVNVSAVLAILRQTPLTVGALLDGLPEDLLGANEGPDTFSPRDVLGHLVFGEETDWVPRIRIILAHGPRRPFTPFDRTGFRAAYAGVGTAELLD